MAEKNKEKNPITISITLLKRASLVHSWQVYLQLAIFLGLNYN